MKLSYFPTLPRQKAPRDYAERLRNSVLRRLDAYEEAVASALRQAADGIIRAIRVTICLHS